MTNETSVADHQRTTRRPADNIGRKAKFRHDCAIERMIEAREYERLFGA